MSMYSDLIAFAPVAQPVEQSPFKGEVARSNRARRKSFLLINQVDK